MNVSYDCAQAGEEAESLVGCHFVNALVVKGEEQSDGPARVAEFEMEARATRKRLGPWRVSKLSKSPKSRASGLLNCAYGEVSNRSQIHATRAPRTGTQGYEII